MVGVVGNCSTVAGVARRMVEAFRGCRDYRDLGVKKAFGAVFSVGGGWFGAFSAQMQLIVAQLCLIFFWGGFVNRNGVVVLLHRD